MRDEKEVFSDITPDPSIRGRLNQARHVVKRDLPQFSTLTVVGLSPHRRRQSAAAADVAVAIGLEVGEDRETTGVAGHRSR